MPLSSRHWKLEPVSFEENEKLAEPLVVSAPGCEPIVVSGAVVSVGAVVYVAIQFWALFAPTTQTVAVVLVSPACDQLLNVAPLTAGAVIRTDCPASAPVSVVVELVTVGRRSRHNAGGVQLSGRAPAPPRRRQACDERSQRARTGLAHDDVAP